MWFLCKIKRKYGSLGNIKLEDPLTKARYINFTEYTYKIYPFLLSCLICYHYKELFVRKQHFYLSIEISKIEDLDAIKISRTQCLSFEKKYRKLGSLLNGMIRISFRMGGGSGFLKFRAAECGGIVAGFLEEITSEWIFRLAKNDEQGQNCSPRSCSDHVWRKKQILGIDLAETKKPDACTPWYAKQMNYSVSRHSI